MEWHSLKYKSHPNGDITAKAEVLPDSPWFSGHFPDDPILPGIALLSMVFDAVTQAHPRKCIITGVKKVRFKRVVNPNDRLVIKVIKNKEKALSYVFKITCKHEVVCTGTLLTGRMQEGLRKNNKKQHE